MKKAPVNNSTTIDRTEFRARLLQEDRELFIKRMRVALYHMAVPLVLSFCVVDFFFAREHLQKFFLARLWIVPVAYVLFGLYRFEIFRGKWHRVPAHLFIVFLGTLNTYLAWCTGIETSPYYAGLNLVGIAAFGFLPWSWRDMALAAALLYGPWFFAVSLRAEYVDLGYLVPRVGFIGSTIMISSIMTYLTYQVRKAELKSRMLLESQVSVQEKLIREKTSEGIYLQRLTNQFSPQVVEAIKKNEISVNSRVRRELTCLFIDVENSTSRSVRIDYAQYAEVPSDFFAKCTEILLAHNVTVGSYLGDGLLAFLNAPSPIKDPQKIAVNACLDILRAHARLQRLYAEKWRTSFNIRIGINTGYATVGFFPNFKKGTYTAVGEPVNLAARLCSLAKPNSVCLTGTFVKNVGAALTQAQVHLLSKAQTIKGSEDETFELFTLIPNHLAELKSLADTCPVCQTKLELKADLGGVQIYKCAACEFTDIQEKNTQSTERQAG